MVTASFNQKMRAFPEEIVNLMENGEITLLSPILRPSQSHNGSGLELETNKSTGCFKNLC